MMNEAIDNDVDNVDNTNESDDDEPLSKMMKKSTPEDSSNIDDMGNLAHDNGDNMSSSPASMVEQDKPKPLTAFAHFFNDTQQSIRNKNATATFEEVSRIVSSMWESLDANARLIYQKKEEEGKQKLEENLHSVVPSMLKKESKSELMETDTDSSLMKDSIALSSLPGVTIIQPNTIAQSSLNYKPVIVNVATSDQLKPAKVITMNPRGQYIVNTQQGSTVAPLVTQNLSTVKGVSLLNQSQVNALPFNPVTKYIITSKGTVVTQQTSSTGAPFKFVTVTTKPQSASPDGQLATSVSKEQLPVHQVTIVKPPTVVNTVSDTMKKPENNESTKDMSNVCTYSACNNLPVKHKKWNEDFCSSSCLVSHCREVFNAWVASRRPA